MIGRYLRRLLRNGTVPTNFVRTTTWISIGSILEKYKKKFVDLHKLHFVLHFVEGHAFGLPGCFIHIRERSLLGEER